MRLTTKGRYAVMALVDLAAYGGAAPVPLSDIALRQEISLPYLEQLFCKLRRAGLVASVRGPGGGYRLVRPAAATPVADVIAAVDETIRATRCAPGSSSGCIGRGGRCLTHDLWAELGNRIHGYLRSVSLADVCAGRVLQADTAAAGTAMRRAVPAARIAAAE